MIVVCVLLMTGCVDDVLNDVPVKSATKESNAFAADAWQARVQSDVYRWRVALPEGCPMPFHFDPDDPDTRQVVLVPDAEWPIPGAIGLYTGSKDEYIDILALPNGTLDEYAYDPNWTPLLHELGHAIGLGHADPQYGPSVMLSAPSVTMQPRDIEAAACILKCGPCGPDPYTYDK